MWCIPYPAPVDERPTEIRAPVWVRPAYLLAGLLALGLGIVGIFLPLVPTVAPLLLAAWCFSRSSHRLHRWLLNHRRLGPMIAPFQSGGVMPRRAKVITLVVMAATFTATFIWLVRGLAPRLALAAAAVISFAAMLRIPTRRRDTEGNTGETP
jgi:uncharacterized membrane protein YbaN (DUF454 family)